MSLFDFLFNDKPKQLEEKKGLTNDEIEAIQHLESNYPVVTPEDIEKAQKEIEEQASKEKLYKIRYLLSTGEIIDGPVLEHKLKAYKELVVLYHPSKRIVPRNYYALKKQMSLSYDRAKGQTMEGRDAVIGDRVISRNFIVSREVVEA